MTYKTIVEGENVLTCDICGDEILIKDSQNVLTITIKNNWYNTFNFQHFDICQKHKKEFMNLIKELKNKTDLEDLK